MWMDTHSNHDISRSHSVALKSVRISAIGQSMLETTNQYVSSFYKAWWIFSQKKSFDVLLVVLTSSISVFCVTL